MMKIQRKTLKIYKNEEIRILGILLISLCLSWKYLVIFTLFYQNRYLITASIVDNALVPIAGVWLVFPVATVVVAVTGLLHRDAHLAGATGELFQAVTVFNFVT